MKSFYLNPLTNDVELDGSNNLRMVEGDDELIQSVWMVVSTNLEEWFLNIDHGFKRKIVLGKNVNFEAVTEELYAAILQDERVSSVEDIQFDYDAATRKLRIDFAFSKQNGEIVKGGFTA